MQTYRLAVYATHVIQYQTPLFRRLASRPEIDLTVFFGSRAGLDPAKDPGFGTRVAWDIALTDGYKHRFIWNANPTDRPNLQFGQIPPSLPWHLWRGRFDAVLVHSYGTPAALLAAASTKVLGIPLLIRTETGFKGGTVRFGAAKRAFLRHVAACLVIGTYNRRFYLELGVPPERLFEVPYAVDNERFAAGTAVRSQTRAALGLADRCVVLFSGKLIARKRPQDLLEAVARLHGAPVSLVLAGDGEMRGDLVERARRQGVDLRVLGFVNQAGLPAIYGAADVLVLPSSFETWGLVVNEGMAASLPVIVSDGVGCAPDLVVPGENGFVYPTGDAQALAARLEPLVASSSLRGRFRARSRQLVERFSLEVGADGVVQALRFACR